MRKQTVEKAPAPSAPAEPKNPVVSITKRVLDLLQNKIIASLMLFGQGILFLVSPSGDMEGTIRISAGIIILACVIMIVFHLKRTQKTVWDRIISGICGLLIAAAIVFIFRPVLIEPYVKTVVGAVTILTGLVNLFHTLKIEKKKDWKFIVSIAGAAAIIVLGIFMLTVDEGGIAVAQRSIGAILILNAIANIWYIIQFSRKEEP
ncbi:MAG: DUF308 domain-containing protein [Clostridia bacterium]|nr:DUF308 domain-containing protein [Clostridia bacterium]